MKFDSAKLFYSYLGTHSLLIGLFPFFLPVYLWKQGHGLNDLSLFIALGGLGFCTGLWVWDRLRMCISFNAFVGITLLLELVLLTSMQTIRFWLPGFVLLGLIYGIYNSFFWTTQRALFYESTHASNAGKQYGNLQLFVGFFLQIGIFCGGFFIERYGLFVISLISISIAISGWWLIWRMQAEYPISLINTPTIGWSDLRHYRDGIRSRRIFLLDGLFLFMESFFWVISLFMISHESFSTLGIMVLMLAVVFGILFFFLKNAIDTFAKHRVLRVSCVLYALSWLVRALVDENMALHWLFLCLVVVTFCTAFFRLAFNKRFYDFAREQGGQRYLIIKSYFTQGALTVAFLCFALYFHNSPFDTHQLQWIYALAAPMALMFAWYRVPDNADGLFGRTAPTDTITTDTQPKEH